MSSIFSGLMDRLNLLGGQQTPIPAGFIGPQQPPVQGPPTPGIMEQMGQSYRKISEQPGFNNALFKLGATLMTAQEKGLGLGEGLLAGQQAYNSQIAAAQEAKHKAIQDMLLQAQTVKALQPESTAVERQLIAAGLQPGTPAFQQAVLKTMFKPDTVVNIGQGAETEFTKQASGAFGKDLVTKRDTALQATDSLRATQEARELLNKGIVTGFGADYRVGLGKALKLAGFNQFDDDIANTESFVASRAQEVGRIIQLFGAGTGLSDADRAYATKAAAGEITLDEKAIKRILDINERASQNIIKSYNRDLGSLKPEVRGVLPFNLDVIEPPKKQVTNFKSVQEAESAKLPKGTQIIINGRRAIVE